MIIKIGVPLYEYGIEERKEVYISDDELLKIAAEVERLKTGAAKTNLCDNCVFVCGLKSHADGPEPRIYCEFWHEMVCSDGECDEFKARGNENE